MEKDEVGMVCGCCSGVVFQRLRMEIHVVASVKSGE
jgi:hypothetical protein